MVKKACHLKKKIEVSPKMSVDKKVYNLRTMKIKENKDEVCDSTKTSKTSLRRRVKNDSEVSKVADLETDKKEINNNPAVKNDSNKRLPVYRTNMILEEKVKIGEEIYEFIDDLPACDQKIKKRKKSIRKPAIKRAKRVTNGLQYNKSSTNIKIKATKNVSKSVQQKEKQSSIEAKQSVKHNVCANNKIPKDLQNMGDRTIAEASTVLILEQNLQKGQKTSHNNSDTSQPDTQDKHMSDHSLIRRSVSPITKEVDGLCIQSPKRSINGFSQVEKLVQSTPQINRTLGKETKLLGQKNLHKKSIYSQDTIHLSSIDNKKLTESNVVRVTYGQKENVLPKKFGVTISNLNSTETEATSIEKHTLIQEKQQSPLKTIMHPNFENSESGQEMQDRIQPPISTDLNKEENKVLKLNKSPKKKIEQTQSSLRFKNLINQIVPSEAILAKNSNSQKENKNPDFTAGPSNPEKSKAIVLRQSNLNNFLNVDEMPKSTRISTGHGIFDDVNNSSIDGKRPEEIFESSNIENAFGFEAYNYSDRSSPIKKKAGPIIATAKDVARSVKGKLFVKARVKSSLTRSMPDNIKRTLLKNIFRKSALILKAPVNQEIVEESSLQIEKCKNLMDGENEKNKSLTEDENEKSTDIIDNNEKNSISVEEQNKNNTSLMEIENENTKIVEDKSGMIPIFIENENEMSSRLMEGENKKQKSPAIVESINIPFDRKKAFLDSISFSDTFDFLSENQEINKRSTEFDEIPMFVDLEPVHFSQPPRRSYAKTKKAVSFNTSRDDSEIQSSDEEKEDLKKPKKKKKKISKLNKEEQKKMQQWIKSMNETFHEIDQFNLTVE